MSFYPYLGNIIIMYGNLPLIKDYFMNSSLDFDSYFNVKAAIVSSIHEAEKHYTYKIQMQLNIY